MSRWRNHYDAYIKITADKLQNTNRVSKRKIERDRNVITSQVRVWISSKGRRFILSRNWIYSELTRPDFVLHCLACFRVASLLNGLDRRSQTSGFQGEIVSFMFTSTLSCSWRLAFWLNECSIENMICSHWYQLQFITDHCDDLWCGHHLR